MKNCQHEHISPEMWITMRWAVRDIYTWEDGGGMEICGFIPTEDVSWLFEVVVLAKLSLLTFSNAAWGSEEKDEQQ